ncbi:9433_t:CDS:1 [Ambispora gerdemannii]|uniref:9433_t:CDS:1 n=1 Tax=Ambispora gerdemannii TaxID=144530 RepID=A0A9N9F3F0_9GLOM|nr:9433_t:CDS:1 [Ambispora gerdemannii]
MESNSDNTNTINIESTSDNTIKEINSLKETIPKYPPQITPNILIEKAVEKLHKTGRRSRIPNAFIAYRMAICSELRISESPGLNQPKLSSLAKDSWKNELPHVRKEYQRIAAEARDIYKNMCDIYAPIDDEYEYSNSNYFSQTFGENDAEECHLENYNIGASADLADLASFPSEQFHQAIQSTYSQQYMQPSILSSNSVSLNPNYPPNQEIGDMKSHISATSNGHYPYMNFEIESNHSNTFHSNLPAPGDNGNDDILCNFCTEKMIEMENSIQSLEEKITKLNYLINDDQI